MTDKENELKLLWTDTEDWITCEIRWYRKDGICYVKDVINKRSEDRKHITPSAKPSDEVLTYENWFERWKQVGYKEWRRDRGKDTTEEREIEIKEVWENQMTFTNVFDCPKCWWHIYWWSTVNYCGECWAKIKRIR